MSPGRFPFISTPVVFLLLLFIILPHHCTAYVRPITSHRQRVHQPPNVLSSSSRRRRRRRPGPMITAAKSVAKDCRPGDRSYAPRSAFGANTEVGTCDVMLRLDELIAEQKRDRQKIRRSFAIFGSPDWGTAVFRISIVVAAYVGYPFLAELLSILPTTDVNQTPAVSNFFGVVSIVFGTLIAATVSDASSRLALLRSLAVDEVTLMLPLVKRLRAESAVCDSRGDADGRALIYDCFTLLMGHTSVLIAGTRDEELQGIASGKDALLRLVERLQPAVTTSRRLGDGGASAAGTADFSFAMAATERIIETRGKRVSLENAGIPELQLGALKVITVSLLLVFAYLSLDRSVYNLTDPQQAPLGAAFALSSSFEQRALFAYLVGSLTLLNNLVEDLSRPFEGQLTLCSTTLVATLVQERRVMAKYLGVPIDTGVGYYGYDE
jgi:hypothetical protein